MWMGYEARIASYPTPASYQAEPEMLYEAAYIHVGTYVCVTSEIVFSFNQML